jgi:hypothetical protein
MPCDRFADQMLRKQAPPRMCTEMRTAEPAHTCGMCGFQQQTNPVKRPTSMEQ